MPTNMIDFAQVDKHLDQQSRYLSRQLIEINASIDVMVNMKMTLNSVIAHIEEVRTDIHNLSQMDLPAEALQYDTESKYVA